MKRILVVIFCAGLAVMNGCTTEPELDKVPVVSYNTDVKRILSSHCNFEGCHGGGGAEAGSLENYTDVMGYVKAGDAHASDLYKVITYKGLLVERRMPPSGYEDVPATDIKMIYWWIEQGAKDN